MAKLSNSGRAGTKKKINRRHRKLQEGVRQSTNKGTLATLGRLRKELNRKSQVTLGAIGYKKRQKVTKAEQAQRTWKQGIQRYQDIGT